MHDHDDGEVEDAERKAQTKSKARAKNNKSAAAVVFASSLLHAEPSAFIGSGAIPGESLPLVRRPGGFSFWRGESPLIETLTPSYQAASA